MSEHEHKPSEAVLGNPTKTNFLLGFFIGLSVISTIGFFTLLLKNGSGSSDTSATVAGAQAARNTNAAAAQPTTTNTATAPDPATTVTTPPTVAADDHVRGPADAPITFIEFSDFQCPYCQSFHPTVQQMMTEYDGKIRLVYKHFPLSFHPNARPAALASECAAEQGKFWEFADKMFEQSDNLSTDYYNQVAGELGLDTDQFTSCFTSEKYKDVVDADYQEGVSAGVQGTPASFIGNQLVSGALPYASIKGYIDNALTQ